MIKHIEIKSYECADIKVLVEINYDLEQVSLLERTTGINERQNFKKKEWVFVGRGPEYKQGWLNILTTMEYAIERAFEELQEYKDMKEKEKISNTEAILTEATKIVKGRSDKSNKK